MSRHNLFAIETSTERLSLAILRGERMHVREIDAGQRHSELALALIHELLDEAALELKDIDVFAFGQGPGSFTGVRIACGLTQGLALGADRPVMPVPTQMALAEQCGAGNAVVALDARMGEIYFAAYVRANPAGEWRSAIAPMLVKPGELPALGDGDWCGIGSGFDVPMLASELTVRYGGQIHRIVNGALPSARDVATIGARRLAEHGIESALAAEFAAPLYLRNKVAMTITERAEHHLKKAAA